MTTVSDKKQQLSDFPFWEAYHVVENQHKNLWDWLHITMKTSMVYDAVIGSIIVHSGEMRGTPLARLNSIGNDPVFVAKCLVKSIKRLKEQHENYL